MNDVNHRSHNDPILTFARAVSGRVSVIPDWRILPGQQSAVMSPTYLIEASVSDSGTLFEPVTPACTTLDALRSHCVEQIELAYERSAQPSSHGHSMTCE